MEGSSQVNYKSCHLFALYVEDEAVAFGIVLQTTNRKIVRSGAIEAEFR